MANIADDGLPLSVNEVGTVPMKRLFKKYIFVIAFAVIAIYASCSVSYAVDNQLAYPKNISAKADTANVVSVIEWGFDKDDGTNSLQAAIDSGAKTVIIPNMGAIWNLRPIRLASNQEIIIEPGVTLMAKRGAFKGKKDCLFSGNGIKNASIKGTNNKIGMWKEDYTGGDYAESEWRHIISLRGCSDIQVSGLEVSSSGGDGIYIGSWKSKPCKNIVVENCCFSDNYRQGMSITSAVNLSILNSTFENTIGTKPAAGIDLEPNYSSDRLSNISIKKCSFQKNQGAGLLIWLNKLNSQSKPVSILCEDGNFNNCFQHAVTIGKLPSSGSEGEIKFKNCTFTNVSLTGLYIVDKPIDSAKLTMESCAWKNVATSKKFAHKSWLSPFYIRIEESHIQSTGNVEFIKCHLFEDKSRPFMVIDNGDKFPSEIKGTITIHSSHVGSKSIKMDKAFPLSHLTLSRIDP